MSGDVEPRKKGPGRFPETDWTNLGRLRGATAAQASLPLDRLAARYWSPIYQYLLAKGHGQAQAQDLAQDFFVFAMTTNLFARADRQRGRFRSFLLAALNNFAANEWRNGSTARRKPTGGVVSLDEIIDDDYLMPASLSHAETPERLFHRSWIHEVVRNVLRELEDACAKSGKRSHFQLFHARVVAPVLDGVDPPPLEEQARELGLEYKEAANQIVTAKRAFLRILWREVRSYSGTEEEMAVEKGEVLRLLSW